MKRLLLLGFFLTAGCLTSFAQTIPDEDGGTPPPTGGPTPASNVPIDGGASVLLASGVAYGLRQLRQRRQQKTNRQAR